MYYIYTIVLVLVALFGTVYTAPGTSDNNLVLLFVDGLRWDLVDGPGLPGFQQLFRSGTRAQRLRPVFPSLCYPNFYTMMTGLYPESHGLIGNNVYDPIQGDFFSSRGDPERYAADHWWEGAEPIWVTAKKQEKSSYLYYLAGCDREINGHRPEHCQKLKNDPRLGEMVESLQHGLSKIQEGKANFVAVYYGEIDTVGHQHGPNSPETKQKVKELDQVVSFLLHDLWERGLSRTTNLVLISDHGMTDASIDRTISLRRLLAKDDVDHILEAGAYVSIWPKHDKIEKVYGQLKVQPHLHVYLRDDIPESWHYKASHRVAPITAVADLGWYIETHDFGYLGFGPRKTPARGMHGYHVHHPDMWGVLAAAGPDIEINKTIAEVGVVDVYQAVAHLLNVAPHPHNGTWNNVAPMFRREQTRQEPFLTSFRYDVIASMNVNSTASFTVRSSFCVTALVTLWLWTNFVK